MDFSTILQTAQIRAMVQEGALERAIHDALFPKQLYRMDVTPQAWPSGVGDTQIFSAAGLMPVDARPLTPTEDPIPVTYPIEQWEAQLNMYGGTTDTHMPSSVLAIQNLFLRNSHQLGMQAGQTLNRIVRNRLFAAGLSGWTVADAASTSTALQVKSLNGFTHARTTTASNTTAVRYSPVSATNPLSIQVFDNGALTTRLVTAAVPTDPKNPWGPGTLTLSVALVGTLDRAVVFSADASAVNRVGGGNSVDSLVAGDIPTLSSIRDSVANFWDNNVPEHADGRFHCHMGAVSQTKIFADAEFQRLMTALPDYYAMKSFALGELLGVAFLRNSESPTVNTVVGGTTPDARDPFPGELVTLDGGAGTVPVHRMLLTGADAITEYYQDMEQLITEAGLNGKVGEPQITNNSIEVFTERVQIVIRSPMNRTQDMVSTTWKFVGDWPCRTDGSTGSASRYKRVNVIEHGA